MRTETLRRIANYLRNTPFHPQWLLGNDAAAGAWIGQSVSGRVLDIGCADRWIEDYLPEDCEYVALDYPATGKNLYGARPNVFADASRLPLSDACVDTVVILEVVEHLLRPDMALKEIVRVLRPQGRVLLSIPFLYPIHDAPYDYQRLTKYGLIRDLESAGLRVDVVLPRLGSAETAGLIACLCLAGISMRAIALRRISVLLVPILLASIPFVNLAAWLGGRLLPPWDAITNGYKLVASKTSRSE